MFRRIFAKSRSVASNEIVGSQGSEGYESGVKIGDHGTESVVSSERFKIDLSRFERSEKRKREDSRRFMNLYHRETFPIRSRVILVVFVVISRPLLPFLTLRNRFFRRCHDPRR